MPLLSGNYVQSEFQIEQEIQLKAPRAKVWQALLDVDGWWRHHFFEPRTRLRLEPWPGGRFMEDVGDGEGALFGTVIYLKAGECLKLSGHLGMHAPVSSFYTLTLEDRADGTVLKLSHRASGLMDPSWKESHENGWGKLWVSLRKLVESGERYAG